MNAKTTMSNARTKLAKFADNVQNSKIYKGAEKAALSVGAGAVALGATAVFAFAEGEGTGIVLSAVNSKAIIDNVMPFVNIGIPVLCAVAGLRLGMKFLRGSMR